MLIDEFAGDTDTWAPVEPDWKEFVEPQLAHAPRKFDHAILETKCPGCDFTVGALVINGPDPVFVEVQCPRDICQEIWSERIS